MDTHATTDLRDLFLKGLSEISQSGRSTAEHWWRQRLVFDSDLLQCVHCDTPLTIAKGSPKDQRAYLEQVIPFAHGGPQRTENLVPVCRSCRKHRGSSDLLLWHPPSIDRSRHESLLKRRMDMLAWSHNHLLRNPELGKKKATIVRHLQRRWMSPRVVVGASLTVGVGLLGFPKTGALPDELVAMVRAMGARPVAPGVFEIAPARFHNAVWALIEHNALVRRIELQGHPDPSPDEPGDAQWHVTYASVLDVQRRRLKRKPVRVSPVERPMVWSERLLLEYRAAGDQGRPFDWEWVNRHRETDDAWERQQRARASLEQKALEKALASMSDFTSDGFTASLERRLTNPGTEDTLTRLAREHGITLVQ